MNCIVVGDRGGDVSVYFFLFNLNYLIKYMSDWNKFCYFFNFGLVLVLSLKCNDRFCWWEDFVFDNKVKFGECEYLIFKENCLMIVIYSDGIVRCWSV